MGDQDTIVSPYHQPLHKKMKSIKVAVFELQAFKISSCLNAHEKHVALFQRLTRVQRSPEKTLCCFVQHGAFHFTAKY